MIERKNTMKRILALIVSLCIVFTFGIFVSADNSINQSYLYNETKSLESYRKISQYLQNGSDKIFSEKASISYDELLNSYGGAFIDLNGRLNINLVNDQKDVKKNINDIAESNALSYVKCDYSYIQLKRIYDYLCDNIVNFSISEVSIIESKNRVFVYCNNMDEMMDKLIGVEESDAIVLCKANSKYSECTTYDLKAGDLITSGSMASSIGFCAKDSSGNKGIIMAGHGVSAVGSYVYNSAGKKIGTVTKRKYSGSVDAAFVKIENGTLTKFNATYKLTDNSDIWSWLPSSSIPEGTQLRKYGFTTGQTYGTVVTNSTTFTVGSTTFSDMVKTTIYAQPGDSGGPVIKTVPSGNCIVGICKGITTESNGTVNMYFTKVNNILNWSGVTPILCP